MAMTVKEVQEWLNGISDENHVAIDEGGLCLVEVESGCGEDFHNYIEVGGVPEFNIGEGEDE